MENARMNMGACAPVFSNIGKMIFENFKKIELFFFHVHIMLILACVSFHGKNLLYVAYTKMTKYPNNTIMIGCAMFTEI
jgi:hypothetical protein